MQNEKLPKIESVIAEIDTGILFISVKIKAAYNSEVHSPKVTAMFESNGRTRFLPLITQTYYANNDLKTCTIVADYKYNLNYIFKDPIENEEVYLSLSLLYGNDYFENIEMTNPGEFMQGQVYKVEYRQELNGGFGGLAISRKEPFIEEKHNPILKFLKGLISFIYYIFIRLLGLVLLPWLLVDAVMNYFGFKESGFVSKEIRTPIRFFVDYLRVGYKAITRTDIGRKDMKVRFALIMSGIFKKSKVVPNRITFLSNRRDDLSGNFEDIYAQIKDDSSLEIKMHLDPRPMHRMSFASIYKFAKLYATSAVVIVDDFYELTSIVPKKEEVKLVQVWHACGAFKTFGFSRIGKPGGPKQTNNNHRMYDRAIVSSSEIRRFYAEGFGIPLKNVVATGVPRTDMFFSEEIKKQKQEEFYSKYPKLRDKKIILFAPTFRGNGRLSGNYPMERFDLSRVYEETNGEYAILVKMHPFVNNKVVIPEKYKDYIIDFSEDSELNDLLFVTDILITDYSSVVFEASLLNIPMLFYAYDLSEYIATRDFYYEYEFFIPGKITPTLKSLISAINNKDFELSRIESFKHKFFDDLDGKSAKRVADMIRGLLPKEE